jgi:hypothetical protein
MVCHRTATGVVLTRVLALALYSAPVAAAKNWNTTNGNWNTAANWSPASVPVGGEEVSTFFWLPGIGVRVR